MPSKTTNPQIPRAKTSNSAEGTQSVKRTLALLRAVAKHNKRGGRLSALAREVELPVSTTRRILQVLAEEGVITYDPVTKLYHLGLELFRLGNQAQQYAIRNRFRPVLERIAEATQDTVFLLIRLGNDALCVDVIQGEYPIRTILVKVGSRRPLGIGAASLALIAFSDPADFERVVTANAPRYHQFKEMTEQKVREMSAQALRDGYVLSDGLFHQDAASVAVPVVDQDGNVICAITVSAIRSRMDEARRKHIAKLVRELTGPEFIGI